MAVGASYDARGDHVGPEQQSHREALMIKRVVVAIKRGSSHHRRDLSGPRRATDAHKEASKLGSRHSLRTFRCDTKHRMDVRSWCRSCGFEGTHGWAAPLAHVEARWNDDIGLRAARVFESFVKGALERTKETYNLLPLERAKMLMDRRQRTEVPRPSRQV